MEGKLINIRKLVALDIRLHGLRFILIEFGVGTPLIIALGLWLLLNNTFFLGLYMLLTGLNYVPLLIYAIIFARDKTAEREVEYELSHYKHYIRKYSIQQFLIFIPLSILLLAIIQKLKGK
jgi:uncharacterized membrane protein